MCTLFLLHAQLGCFIHFSAQGVPGKKIYAKLGSAFLLRFCDPIDPIVLILFVFPCSMPHKSARASASLLFERG
jgi:hypothetical protein